MVVSTSERLKCKVINGAVAGVAGVTCTFPLDLVKTRMQNQVKSSGGAQYRNVFHCFSSIVKTDGLRGLYRGVGVNLLLINPEKAIKLVVNDELRRHFMVKSGQKSLSIKHEVMAGAGAGACQIVITTPMELMKINLQLASKVPGNTLTALSLFKKTLADKGIRGLYKGTIATAARDITFSVIYFPAFSKVSELFIKPEDTGLSKFYKTLCIAMFAGAVASGSVTPMDVVKTRIQTVLPGMQANEFKGILDCTQHILKNEGASALFKGCVPRMSVIAPLFAIAQSVYFLGVAEKVLSVNSLY